MNQTQKSKLKKTIQQRIQTLNSELIDLEKDLEPILDDCTLCDVTRQEAQYEQEVFAAVYAKAKQELTGLHAALSHIDETDFGICSVCDEPIAIARLELVPQTTMCIRCANETI